MKIILMIIMLLNSSVFGKDNFTLSCSRPDRGTQIFFINGIMNSELKAFNSVGAIKRLINTNSILERIDQNKQVQIDHLYNYSEEFGLDFLQLIFQKIEEAGELPNSRRIASFLFQKAHFCLLRPLICAGVGVAGAGLLLKQKYISSEDVRQMTDLVAFNLINNHKVIIVSHSQGNLYANYIYDELVRRGFSKDQLEKYLGNLQVGTVATYVRPKNHRIFLAADDLAVASLRLMFPSVKAGNYFVQNTSTLRDLEKHGFVETYLSSELAFKGSKQGKGFVTRFASDVFLENLEEVAWMLANNDENCCDGRDGRLHINPNKTVGGFIEESVQLADKGLSLELDKESQICGNVSIPSPNDVNNNDLVSNIKLMNGSSVHAEYPVSLGGNITLDETTITNYTHEFGASYKGNPEGLGLKATNSFLHGGVYFEGDLYATDLTTYDSPIISSHTVTVQGDYESYPTLNNVQLSGEESTLGGMFYISTMDAFNLRVNGEVAENAESWNILHLNGDKDMDGIKDYSFHNLDLNGIGFINAQLDNGVHTEGYRLGDHIGGVIVKGDAKIHATTQGTTSLRGSMLIEAGTHFSGSWIGDLVKEGQYVGHATNSELANVNVYDAPRIASVTASGGSFSGTSYSLNASLTNCHVLCNAFVNEIASNKTFQCGYVSGSKTQENESMMRYKNAIEESRNEYLVTLNSLMNHFR